MRTLSTLALGLLLVTSAADAQMRDRAGPFERADANGDGIVTKEEFMKARAEQFGSRDRNGDGFIDDSDLGRRAAKRPRASQAMNAMQKQFDADNDGKVSKGEFIDGGVKLFALADSNKDGSLDQKEREAAQATLRETAGREAD